MVLSFFTKVFTFLEDLYGACVKSMHVQRDCIVLITGTCFAKY